MAGANTQISIKVLRSETDTEKDPYYQDYAVPVEKDMTVLQALEYIYENLDSSLGFRRFCCGIQFCNSCLMSINGQTAHACLAKLEKKEYVLEPLRGFPVIKDLIVELKNN